MMASIFSNAFRFDACRTGRLSRFKDSGFMRMCRR